MNFFKGRAILWLLIPLAFVIAFLWERPAPSQPTFIQEKTNPDYFLVKTRTIEFTADGLAERKFTSDKTLHYLFKQETSMENPVLVFNNDDNETWQVTAKTAVSKELTSELLLEQGVEISMQQIDGNNTVLTTNNLTIDFASENAFTDNKVFLKNPLFQLTATGMNVDLKENIIHFKSQVTAEEL